MLGETRPRSDGGQPPAASIPGTVLHLSSASSEPSPSVSGKASIRSVSAPPAPPTPPTWIVYFLRSLEVEQEVRCRCGLAATSRVMRDVRRVPLVDRDDGGEAAGPQLHAVVDRRREVVPDGLAEVDAVAGRRLRITAAERLPVAVRVEGVGLRGRLRRVDLQDVLGLREPPGIEARDSCRWRAAPRARLRERRRARTGSRRRR